MVPVGLVSRLTRTTTEEVRKSACNDDVDDGSIMITMKDQGHS